MQVSQAGRLFYPWYSRQSFDCHEGSDYSGRKVSLLQVRKGVQMLSESITRIDVAYDQLITASLIGHKKDLSADDQTELSLAINCIKSVLDRHQTTK